MDKLSFQQRQILWRATIKEKRLIPHIKNSGLMLDIGSGNGGLVYLLREKHSINIQPLDIADKSKFDDVQPIIFDGRQIPFKANSFDCVMLITVLHHIEKPENLLEEALRVSSNRVIVMEDIYDNFLQKHLTFWMDSLVNWEFSEHPHSNKCDNEWKETFNKLGLEIEFIQYYHFALFFKQVLYVLKKKKGRSK